MKKKFKVYNFEFGTITNQKETVRVDMESSQFNIDNLDELRSHYGYDRPYFLELQDIKESDTTISLIFHKRGGVKNLRDIKKEEYPVKIAIAQRILEQDILNEFEDDLYVSLNPSTIYYYPMQTVNYTYIANHDMPKDAHTRLERYKACVVSILSGIGYEKCLNSPEDVKKQGNELIKEIYEQNSRAELLNFIKQSNNYMTYDYLERRTETENKIKKKYLYMLAGVAFLGIAGTGFLATRLSNQEAQLAQAYEAQLEEKDTLIEANEAFYNEDYETAIELFNSIDYDTELLASRLIEQEQYQLALNVEENSLEDIIVTMYEREQEEQLLELEVSEESGVSRKLDNEQIIVERDTTAMLNVLNFLNDENTAVRLAEAYVELDDLSSANQILEEYPDNPELQELVDEGQNNQQRNEIQDSISDLQEELEGLDEDEEDDQERIEEIQDTISELESQLEELDDEEGEEAEEEDPDDEGDE